MARGTGGNQKVLFARIGWMHFYNGSVPGDERPVGGGSYNRENLGHEVYNFRVTNSRIHGYFQAPGYGSIALERIDPNAHDLDSLSRVLVVFVAPHPDGLDGLVVVGWYADAEVFRNIVHQSPGKPTGYGHYCSAEQRNCVLLPNDKRRTKVPSGTGGFGQSNVCYSLSLNRTLKDAPWINAVLNFVDSCRGPNLLDEPEADAEEESADAAEKALARSQGQGFARTSRERRILEDYAMAAAEKYYRDKNFNVKNVSKTQPYDLECKKGSIELHVEVKGTTTLGNIIVLTRGEIEHVCNGGNRCALFVLHSIQLQRNTASGGERFILEPWEPLQTNLKPINYTYRLR